MVIFVFWILVMALTLAALALLLPPLLRATRPQGNTRRTIERELAALKRRHDAGDIDAATYASQREPLSARLIAEVESTDPPPARWLATTLAIALPATALALYFMIGRPDALDHRASTTANANATPQDMTAALASLEARLRENPDDVDGWLLLARSYRSMQQFNDMLRASSSAYKLSPASPDVMVEHAEALALTSPSRRLEGESRRLLDASLATDANHQKTLWLLGVSELQSGNNEAAIDYWQRLRALLPAGDSVANSIDEQIAAARARMGSSPAGNAPAIVASNGAPASSTSPESAASTANDAAPGPQLLVTVEIDDTLQSRVAAGDTLFVFVRSPAGGPPLAIRRIASPTFPVSVTLTQADRMMEGMQIEADREISVGARVSKSGQAQAQPGDLQASAKTLTQAANSTVALRIDSIVE